MNITHHSVKKAAATLTLAALLSLSSAPAAFAAGEISISGAVAGATVLAQNGSGTVLATFSPDLHLVVSSNASLERNATSSTDAYYGVDVSSATSSPNVHWRVTVHHATSTLSSGDVAIHEVGTYGPTSGHVRTPPATYSTTESSGDLVMNGDISGWSVHSGDQFTNVDQITFAPTAPTGMYTVTRALIDEDNGNTPFDAPFSFTLDLTPASSTATTTPPTSTTTPDTIPPAPPVILYPTSPTSTSTSPINVYGTAEASSSIRITGGAGTSTGTTTGAGTWNASVGLNASSTNTLLVTATDAAGNTSLPATLIVMSTASSTATTTPPTSTTTPPVDTGGGTGDAGSSRPPGRGRSGDFAPGFSSNMNSVIAGEVLGASTFFPGIPTTGGGVSFQFLTDLSFGMRSDDVATLQALLGQLGYFKGPITGYFGPLTRDALMRLQRANGLSATGKLDAQTRFFFSS